LLQWKVNTNYPLYSKTLVTPSLDALQTLIPPHLILEPLSRDFLTGVVDLDRLCFGGLWTENGYSEELNRDSSDLLIIRPRCFSASSPPVLAVGCSWSILEEAHIVLLGVHPNHRRQGVGYGMLCSLLLIGKQRGLERATLEVRRSNLAALALYESVGFQILGQRNGYYHDNGEDAVILWLNGLQQMKTPVA